MPNRPDRTHTLGAYAKPIFENGWFDPSNELLAERDGLRRP